MMKRVSINILDDFEELSSIELQEDYWLNNSGKVSSYVELMCRLFDESQIEHYLKINFFNHWLSKEIRELISMLEEFDGEHMTPEEILSNSQWKKISLKAAKILPRLKSFFNELIFKN